MTELMKRYCKENSCCHTTISAYGLTMQTPAYVAWLAAQLTWRPVSEKPEKAGLYNIRFTRDGIIRVFTSVAVYDEVFEDEEQGFDGWYDIPQDVHVISWLPIPPAPEA